MAEASGGIFGAINAETADEFDSITTVDGVVFERAEAAAIHESWGFKVTGDGTNQGEYGVKGFSGVTEGYWRFYINIPTDQLTVAYDYIWPFYLQDGGVNLVTVGFRGGVAGVPYTWRVQGDQITSTSFTDNFTINAAHYIDIYWKAATVANNDGITRVWVDGGGPYFAETDNATSTRIADQVKFGNVDGVMENGDYYYLDDLIGHTSLVGAYPLGGGSSIAPIAMAHYMRRRR